MSVSPPRRSTAGRSTAGRSIAGRSTAGRSRAFRDDTSVLLRRVDSHLATLRQQLTTTRGGAGSHDLATAELLAGSLRELVTSTAAASAADRAQVRAAVHYFVMRRRRLARALIGERRMIKGDVRVVNDTARRLGREDLVVELF